MPESCISQMQASDDSTYQQKRKRRNSTVSEPIRKSRRLQKQASISSFTHTKAEHSIAKQPNLLPSPSTSRTPPKASRDGRKRKAGVPSEGAPFGLGTSGADIESCKQPPESEPAAASPSLDPREQLELPREGLSKKQDVRFKNAVPRTSAPIIKSSEEPAKELKAQEIGQKERQNPISYWAAHLTWPKSFAEHDLMALSNATNKRQRTLDSEDPRSRSYSQSRKYGEVPEQYTAAYQTHILIKCLDMDCEKGEDFTSKESKETCAELLRIDIGTIGPTTVPQDKIRSMIFSCQNRNEGIVNRDVTPLIIPSLRLLYYCGANNLKHVVDEVKAIWYQQCVLEGPRPCPDLAIGLFLSAFTEREIGKLNRYMSVDNWTHVTSQMFFPFLMCEIKCGREGLDMANRQNMHSCSVAVRAILRIEQEADKYRSEQKMDNINGQVLVFSISHDQQDARLYGHYAIVQKKKWSYYRYFIRSFCLFDYNSLLAIHSFVQNILKSHLPRHVQRLKDAIAALPDPNEISESNTLLTSSGLSFAASEIILNDDDNSQQDSLRRDADGFVVPPRPTGSQNIRAKKKGLRQLLEEQREEAKQEKAQKAQLMQMLEEQHEEAKQEKAQLMQMLEELREEAKQEKAQKAQLMQMLVGATRGTSHADFGEGGPTGGTVGAGDGGAT